MEEITVEIRRCRNCGTIQWPRLDAKTKTLLWPNVCKNQKCKSPYWNKERVRDPAIWDPERKKKQMQG